jgi:undecaprenyl-diphosphatase
MPAALRKVHQFFVGREPLLFVAALVISAGVWGFIKLSGEVREGETAAFDARILKAFRQPQDPNLLRGPRWTQTVVRDVTALGGAVVMALVVVAVCGFLLLTRRHHMMWLVLAATIGATAINSTIKNVVRRERPQIVPQLTDVSSESFPSGHSAMSAAVYLTLGGLLAQTVSHRRVKLYFLALAMLATGLVGLSRVMLGVHYPTDVLGGWMTGLLWALCCWLVARYLQRRGKLEREDDPTASSAQQP